MIISKEDQEFIQFLMRKYNIRGVKFAFSDSKKKWPDIWISGLDQDTPTVTVTREWQSQSFRERCSRIVHELILHYVKRMDHNEKIGFSTIPARDSYSKKVYQSLIKNPFQNLSPEIRKIKIREINDLTVKMKTYGNINNGHLTTKQGKEYELLRDKIDELKYEISKPVNLSKIASLSERKSTLTTEIVSVAFSDLMENKDIYNAITKSAAGVWFSKNTPVDEIMTGHNLKVTPTMLYNNFQNTRNSIRKEFGNTIKLYRATGKQIKKPTTNWATTKEFAEQFGSNIISKIVPVKDILAVNVSSNGGYHEIILGD